MRWISSEKRLPKEDTWVFGYQDFCKVQKDAPPMCFAKIIDGVWYYDTEYDNGEFCLIETFISFWQPLPKAPVTNITGSLPRKSKSVAR